MDSKKGQVVCKEEPYPKIIQRLEEEYFTNWSGTQRIDKSKLTSPDLEPVEILFEIHYLYLYNRVVIENRENRE